MKLQFVHKEILRGKGSSVHCQWIRHPQETGAPLVAVWMDPAMNVFELQFASNPGTETPAGDLPEETNPAEPHGNTKTDRTIGRSPLAANDVEGPVAGKGRWKRLARRTLWVYFSCALWGVAGQAQDSPSAPPAEGSETGQTGALAGDEGESLTTMFRHPEWKRLWLSGQANWITQYHPSFPSPYQGKNSLTPEADAATSRVLTLFTGWQAAGTTEFLFDVQETGGAGLGNALGAAGFFDLDVVRNPQLSKAPYIARLMWHQIIPLSRKKVVAERNAFSLFRELPERRLELRFGKFSMVDFFDLNHYGTDSSFQFMNWTVDNNGVYDYAADTRGFTFGALLEYRDGDKLAVRFAEALMPKVANGINLEADLSLAQSENFEVELHRRVVGKQAGTLRLLSYVNHANMGVYRQAINNYLDGVTPTPQITAHPLQTTIKYGFGINFEQAVSEYFGLFGRWGWNEGQHESFAYTEVDQTWQFGVGGSGGNWGRKNDRLGLVFVSNGISHEHARYLGYGGFGFLLGDGKLSYGRENILETYYTVHVWRGFFPSAGLQYMVNPGYNTARGPVIVPSLRLHLEF